MNCRRTRDLLARRLLDDLDGSERDAVDRHLGTCDECRRAAGDIDGTLGVLRDALSATRPAPSRLSAVRRREVLAQPPRAAPAWEWFLQPHRALAAAAAILVAGGFVAVLVRHMEFKPPAQEVKQAGGEAGQLEAGLPEDARAVAEPVRPAPPAQDVLRRRIAVGFDKPAELAREQDESARSGGRDEGKAKIASKLARSKVDSSLTVVATEPKPMADRARDDEAAARPFPGLAGGRQADAGEKVFAGERQEEREIPGEFDSVDLAAAFSPADSSRKLEAGADDAANAKPAAPKPEMPADALKAGKGGGGAGDWARATAAPAPAAGAPARKELMPLAGKAGAAKDSAAVFNVEVEGSLSPVDAGRRLIRVRIVGDAGDGRVVVVSRVGALWRVDSGKAGPGDRLSEGLEEESALRRAGKPLEVAWFELQVDSKTPDSELVAEVCLRSDAGDRVLHRIYARDVAAAFESARADFREGASSVAGMLAPAKVRMPVLSKAAREADVSTEAVEPPDPAPMIEAPDAEPANR